MPRSLYSLASRIARVGDEGIAARDATNALQEIAEGSGAIHKAARPFLQSGEKGLLVPVANSKNDHSDAVIDAAKEADRLASFAVGKA
jgi:hypothetical protein